MTPNINKILKRPAFNGSSPRGSDMGRSNQAAYDAGNHPTGKLYVQHMRMVDGCYDVGGAYWGGPDTMWCGFNADLTIMVYVRADSRKEAKANVLAALPRVN